MAKRLILIGWEAADWRILHPLIDSGKMPALQRIVEQGASGSMLCGRPLLPAPQWTSLITGKRPWQHGVCHQFQQDLGTGRTIPISAAHRKCASLWEMLAREGKKSIIVGWPATHGARGENALIVSNRYAEPTVGPEVRPWTPAFPGTYWPVNLSSSLDPVRVSPEDILADMLSQYLPDWKQIDQTRDRRLGQLRVFLAADLSHHTALMNLLKSNDWDFSAIQFPALGPISALFLPYATPRREWIAESEFQLYQHVVDAACIFLDRLLHSLVQALGPDTAVLLASAHGVNRDLPPHYLRGGDRESWKSARGILAACGPGFSRDSLLLGATIQDVTPTILTWFGLPIGEDMEGRVLMESFASAPEVKRVESWETGQTQVRAQDDSTPITSPDSPMGVRLKRESDWHLALSYLDGARHADALIVLEKLFRSFPERADFALALFQCQLTLKQTDPAAVTLELLLESVPPGVWSLVPRAELLIARGDWKEARVLAAEIQALKPSDPEILRRLGMLLWRLREWHALSDLSRQVIEWNENEPLAWLGLAESAFRLRQPDQAIEAAMRAIALNYFLPAAHEVMFRSLLMKGKWAEAREAMQTVMRMQPDNRAAKAYAKRTGPGKTSEPNKKS